MLVLAIIVLTSLAGMLAIWFLTGGLSGAGNALMSLLVGFAIALLWARAFMQLERRYLEGSFDRVRRWLWLWRGSMGAVDTHLVRLQTAVETRRSEEVKRLVTEAERQGLGDFARLWSRGHMRRLQGDVSGALTCFLGGAESETFGLDRAELYCEGARLLLQVGSDPERGVREEDLQRAIEVSNRAGSLVRSSSDVGRDARSRLGYVELLHRSVRGLIYLRQGRWQEADRIFGEVIGHANNHPSLRARRLKRALEIERLRILPRTEGEGAFARARAEVSNTGLPELRLRLQEVEGEVKEAERRLRQAAQQADDPFAADGGDDANLFTASGPDARGYDRLAIRMGEPPEEEGGTAAPASLI